MQGQEPMLTVAFIVLKDFANTIQACTALPGAADVISQKVALLAAKIVAEGCDNTPSTAAHLNPGQPTAGAVNYPDYSLLDAHLHSNSCNHNKYSPLPQAQSQAAATVALTQCAGPAAFTSSLGALTCQHVSGLPERRPQNEGMTLCRLTSNESGAGASKTSSEGQGCRDVMAAQCALAIAMGLQQSSQLHQPPALMINAPETPVLADCGAFGMYGNVIHPLSMSDDRVQQPFTMDDLQAAEALASLRSSSSLLLPHDRQDSSALQAQQWGPAPTQMMPSPLMMNSKHKKPRRAPAAKPPVQGGGVKKQTAAKKRSSAPGHKGHGAHVSLC